MSLDLSSDIEREKLREAIERNWEYSLPNKTLRRNLIDIYRGRSVNDALLTDSLSRHEDTLLNLFQSYARGHLLSVAHQLPKWSVKARTLKARGLDRDIQQFLTRYSEILDLARVFRQAALDSVFGTAVIKVLGGPPPMKGITSPVVPRAYRISPDHLITDLTAPTPEEGLFIADVYLVNLREAMQHEHFDPEVRSRLVPWRDDANSDQMIPERYSDDDMLAAEMTRLIDVYIPKLGAIITWASNNGSTNRFSEMSGPPLSVTPTPVNPYAILQLLETPDSTEEISHLSALRGLHLLANDMLQKAAKQGRDSKRNPISQTGLEQDLDTLLQRPDGAGVLLDNPKDVDVFALPGPDGSVVQLGQIAAGMFSQQAGNLDVALGHSAGADTARQTGALINQVGQNQALDRVAFEGFMAQVGKKLVSLAFHMPLLKLNMMSRVPGTSFAYPVSWPPPNLMPEMANIDEYNFEVVPYSSAYRSPQERLSQLQAASQGVLQWMMAAANGLPVNLPAIIRSYEDAYDLVGDLQEWLSEQPPTPQERTQNQYMGTPGAHEGTRVQYQGSMSGQGSGAGAPLPESPAGLQSGGA